MSTATSRPVPTGAEIGDGHPLTLSLLVLTLVSGIVDGVSYLGLGHVFTANMTGNVVVVGFAIAGAPGFSAAGSLTSLGAFLLGSAWAGRLAIRHRHSSRPTWFRTALLLEASLQALATVIGFTVGVRHTQLGLIAVLGLSMGLRNGTVRKLAVPDISTTVLTMTLTGIAADSSLAGGANTRLRRRVLTVVAMIAGAAPGAALVLHGHGAWALLLATTLVTVVALVYRER
ncbi:YoaK family protein [Streptacidiphilus neutrinimicus]|uniref:YoaK family protein n=1 Tax=Streptacidiphilus neutrinimicus TaxID=105420 RepID=UPI0005AA3190|nr:YoaK family protein [Streptacidiphilus neutrinimicus]